MRTATKSELRDEIKQLRFIGAQMSNVCFNWSQCTMKTEITQEDREILNELRIKWDMIKRT